MNLGNHFASARKKAGLSQEEVAEKLGVSRQTISKWETGETLPDIYQSKKLALCYHLSLDKLIEFDSEVEEIRQVIENTSEETQQKIDWTKMWAEKYPVLAAYPKEVDTVYYTEELTKLINRLKARQGYNDMDAMLVLKDILGHIWNA